MSDIRRPKVKEKIRVVTDSTEHPFISNTIVTVTELKNYGVVWAKTEDGSIGCLVPDDYVFLDSSE